MLRLVVHGSEVFLQANTMVIESFGANHVSKILGRWLLPCNLT
jgi:hypothetical protein